MGRCRGRGVGLEVAVVLVGFNLERAQNLHAFIRFQRGPGGRGYGAGRWRGGGSCWRAFEGGEAPAEGRVFFLQFLQGVAVGGVAHGGGHGHQRG